MKALIDKSASKPPPQASSHPTQPYQSLRGGWKGLLQSPRSALIIMIISIFLFGLNFISHGVDGASGEKTRPGPFEAGNQEALGYEMDSRRYKLACPDYRHYAVIPQ